MAFGATRMALLRAAGCRGKGEAASRRGEDRCGGSHAHRPPSVMAGLSPVFQLPSMRPRIVLFFVEPEMLAEMQQLYPHESCNNHRLIPAFTGMRSSKGSSKEP